MGFWDWFRRGLPNWAHTDDRWYRMPFVVNGVNTLSGKPVDENTALTYSAVWCAIALISGTVGSLPLHLYKTKKSGGKDRVTDHLLDEMLHGRPNSEMTAMNYRETSMSHVLSWGNWYSNIVRAKNGQVIELWPISPNRVVEVKRGDDGELYYKVQVGGKTVTLSRFEMLHIPGLGFDGIMGYSVISYARESIGLGLGTEEFGARYFGDGTHPGVIVSHEKTLSPQAHENLKKSLQDKYGSLGKSHRLLLLDEGMKLEKIGIPPNDSQFLESRQHQITEVARWFNVPPHKIKDLVRATFSNIEEQNIEFVVDTCQPWLIRIEQNLNHQLLTPEERERGLYFKHNVEGLLRGSSKARSEFYYKLWQMGGITPNEIREKEDMNPFEGGDKHYVPVNYYSVEDGPPAPQIISPSGRDWPDYSPVFIDLKAQNYSLAQGMQHLITCVNELSQRLLVVENREQAVPDEIKDAMNYIMLGVDKIREQKQLPAPENELVITDEFKNFFTDKLAIITQSMAEQEEKRIQFDCSPQLQTQIEATQELMTKIEQKTGNLINETREAQKRESVKIKKALAEIEKRGSEQNELQHEKLIQHINEYFHKNNVAHEEKLVLFSEIAGQLEKIFGENLIGAGKIISGQMQNDFARVLESFGSLENYLAANKQLLTDIQAENAENRQFQGENSAEIIDFTERLLEKRIRESSEQGFKELKGDMSNLISQEFHRLALSEKEKIEAVQKAVEIVRKEEREKRAELEARYEEMYGKLTETTKQIIAEKSKSEKDVKESLEEIREQIKEREERHKKERKIQAIVARDRIAEHFYPLIRDVAQQIVTKEVLALKKAMQKYDAKDFMKWKEARNNLSNWLDKFYSDMPMWVRKKIEPTLRAYMEEIQAQVAEEVGAPVGIDPEMEAYIHEYIEGFSRQYVDSSYGQMKDLLDKETDEIEKRADEWSEKRPDKVAQQQTASCSNAIALKVFTGQGLFAVWTIRGVKTCPACRSLDGKKVGMNEFFVQAGTDLDMGEGEKPMHIRHKTLYCPLHQGCDCFLMPG